MIFRTTSHRSRDRIERLLGEHPQYYFKWTAADSEGFFVNVTDPEQIEQVKALKGISKSRDQILSNYRKCMLG